MKTTILACLLSTAILVAPTATAFEWPDWFSGERVSAPAAPNPLEGVDLTEARDRVGIVSVTGITDLTVLDFETMIMTLEPDTDGLHVTQTPKPDYRFGRPSQLTVINETTDLVLITSAYYTWYAGSQPQPAEAITDPTYIFRSNVPRVSVMNAVPQAVLLPDQSAGPGTVTSSLIELKEIDPTLLPNAPDATAIDVDGQLSLVNETKVYPVTAAVTTATTDVDIKSMLDEIGLVGATLSGVLSSLDNAGSPEVGVVDSQSVADSLAGQGVMLRKVVDTGITPAVYYHPKGRELDFVNPSALDGEIVLLSTTELKDVSESQIVGLKNSAASFDTRILTLFKSQYPQLPECNCFSMMEFDPKAGGITDAYADMITADKFLDDTALFVDVDPDDALPDTPDTRPYLTGANTKKIRAASTAGTTYRRPTRPTLSPSPRASMSG